MRPSILAFDDYRRFLRQEMAARKRANPLWSYASFAHALGLKSATSIHKIVRGRRDPSAGLATRIGHYFAFTPGESAHFAKLVMTQRANGDAPPAAPAAVAAAPAERVLTEGEFNALSAWWCYAIRQMARWSTFRADPAWLQARFRFPVRRVAIRRTLAALEKFGALARQKDGRLRPGADGLSFAADARGSAAVREYHRQMLGHATEALAAMTPAERWVSGLTLAMDGARVAEARAELATFLRRFNDRFGVEAGGDGVYQLSLQLFPLAEEERKT